MNNKKGISAVVATVLIILITVAAVAIIWAAIIPMVTDTLDGGTACLDGDRAFEIVSGEYTCSDGTDTTVQIRRVAGSDLDLNDFTVSVAVDGSTSETAADPVEDPLAVGPNDEKVYTFSGVAADSATVYATVNTGDGGNTKDCAAVTKVIPAC